MGIFLQQPIGSACALQNSPWKPFALCENKEWHLLHSYKIRPSVECNRVEKVERKFLQVSDLEMLQRLLEIPGKCP